MATKRFHRLKHEKTVNRSKVDGLGRVRELHLRCEDCGQVWMIVTRITPATTRNGKG